MRWRGVRPLVFCLALALVGCSVVDPRVEKRWKGIRTATPARGAESLTTPPIPPVVFIPGSKGSVLRRDDCQGKELWGNTRVVVLSKLDDLLIPLPGVPLAERFRQRVAPCEVLGAFEVRVLVPFPVTFEYPIYRGLVEILERAGGFAPGRTAFYFPFDWRLDNRIAAVELAAALPFYRQRYYEKYLLPEYCEEWRPGVNVQQCLEAIYSNPDWRHLVSKNDADPANTYAIKFNIVTHSMGGLVAQYLIRGLGYGGDVNNLLLIASPAEGAMFPLRIMVSGELALGDVLFHFYEAKETRPIGFSFPSAFQGLPRYDQALRSGPEWQPESSFQREMGLSDWMPRGPEQTWEQITRKWATVLDLGDASWELICRQSIENYRAARDRAECERRIALHLEAELQSSINFQKTVNQGLCALGPQTMEDEARKVRDAKEILAKIRPRREDMPWASPEAWRQAVDLVVHRSCSALVAGPPAHDEEPRNTHQFFGHCDDTLTFAEARTEEGRERITFCEAGGSGENRCQAFGDHRIPRLSMDALRKRVKRASAVVLCVDHTRVVTSAFVQDNLLRFLLEDRLGLVP